MHEFDDLYYVDADFVKNSEIDIPQDESNHLVRVKRAKNEDNIHLCNGHGKHAVASWYSTGKKSVRAKILDVFSVQKNRNIEIFLAPALLKRTHFEWLLEKSTELSVDHIIPLISHRIVADKPKRDRWEKIVISSLKQSKNFWKPTLHQPVDIGKLQLEYPDVEWLCFHEKASQEIHKDVFSSDSKKYGIVIGPEGGLTDEEINHFNQVYLLSSSRLRAETAAITAINQVDLLYRWILPSS